MRYGRKTRKDWRVSCWESTLSKSVDPSCQNNNSCEYCRSNRLYASTKQEQKANNIFKDDVIDKLYLNDYVKIHLLFRYPNRDMCEENYFDVDEKGSKFILNRNADNSGIDIPIS